MNTEIVTFNIDMRMALTVCMNSNVLCSNYCIIIGLGICIYEDRSFDWRYILFSNGNWTISQACGDFNVTTSNIMCNHSNRRWDQDVLCPGRINYTIISTQEI